MVTSKHSCLCILFIRLTTCFGHCGPSSGHKNIYNEEKIHSLRTLVVVPILSFERNLVVNGYLYLPDECVISFNMDNRKTRRSRSKLRIGTTTNVLKLYIFSSIYIFVT